MFWLIHQRITPKDHLNEKSIKYTFQKAALEQIIILFQYINF